MNINLFKVSAVCWVVTSAKHAGEPQVFDNPDDASMYLEDIGIPDEEVDAALIDMAANKTIRASFGMNKTFERSDDTYFSDLPGTT
jgi:hypothetical protein